MNLWKKFFTGVILIVATALVYIWLQQKPARPREKAPPFSQLVPKTNRPVPPVQVLVLNKTNLITGNEARPVSAESNATKIVPLPKVEPTSAIVSRPNLPLSHPPFVEGQRPVQDVFEAQVALARRGISAGSMDGVIGSQTRSALRAFQRAEKLSVTGELDPATKTNLLLTAPLYSTVVITTNDLERLRPVGTTWLSKSQQERLEYETILELVAEKSFCHPGFIKQINPGVNWTNISEGMSVRVPNVELAKPKAMAALIRIRLSEKTLEAFDENTNLLAHFPCSIARRIEKRPVGELRIEKLAPNPDYTFAPENFPESAEARTLKTKLILPPGPNNPVGTVWIGLDKPGYGIHGTPKPEDVGRTESHGCFRLANWNAEYLLRLVTIGTPVLVEP